MKEMKVGRNLKERREEARDEDTNAFIFIERPKNKAQALKVIMRYNLYATLRDFVLNFSLGLLLLSNISRACYIRARSRNLRKHTVLTFQTTS